jgi:hypothetical protein
MHQRPMEHGHRFREALFVSNRFIGEQVIFQLLVESRILPAYPFQNHCSMFFFFIAVVRENGFQFLVFAGIRLAGYTSPPLPILPSRT